MQKKASHPYPIFDGHNDTVLHLLLENRGHGRTFFEESTHGHIDLPRAKAGGLCGGFFALYVPNEPYKPKDPNLKTENDPNITLHKDSYEVKMAETVETLFAQEFIGKALATLLRVERESNGAVVICKSASEIRSAIERGVFAILLHMEGAEAIDEDFYMLDVLYASGLRSIGPVWSRPNIFGYGVPFRSPSTPDTGPGLTDLGKELVRRCNQLGIMLDCAHLNEKGFWDVEGLSNKPLVVTHTCSNALSATARNITDKQIDAVGASGGVIGVNFYVADLKAESRWDPSTSLTEIVKHLDYIEKRIGIEHVAFGSDFDGALMPQDLGDAAGLGELIAALENHGYEAQALQKITHQNWLRLLENTLAEK